MDPTSIDAVQVGWLWKLANGLALVVTAIIAYSWRRLDARVSKLESESADHTDIENLRQEIRDLSGRIDRMIEIVLGRQL